MKNWLYHYMRKKVEGGYIETDSEKRLTEILKNCNLVEKKKRGTNG